MKAIHPSAKYLARKTPAGVPRSAILSIQRVLVEVTQKTSKIEKSRLDISKLCTGHYSSLCFGTNVKF